MLTGFGADSTVEVDVEDDYDLDAVSVIEVGGAVVAVDYNGFQGPLPEVLARVSADGGVAASMFWNVNDDNAFTCARNGDLVTTVDLYDPEDAGEVEIPERVRVLLESAAEDGVDLRATGLSMVQAYVGVQIPRSAIEAVTTRHPISAVS